jgi:hypothetical protein
VPICPSQRSSLISRTPSEIIKRNQQLLDSLPLQLRFNPDQREIKDTLQLFMAAQEYLCILHNQFMIQRHLCHRLGNDTAKLLGLSQRMLSVTLEVSSIRSSLPNLIRFAPWVTVFYGLPAAAVLVLELIRQKRQPTDPVPGFSRAQVIQDLSVFVANLRWVHQPGDGNYPMADQARRSLQQILNDVLADPSPPTYATPISLLQPDMSNQFTDDPWPGNSDFDVEFWMDLPSNLSM